MFLRQKKIHISSKEKYLTQYHIIPFHNIPKVMIIYLAFELVIKLNYFPFKGVLSPYYGPWTIVDKQTLEYNKICTIKFGEVSQANNENNMKNSNV